ncbi:MAG: helix-hairpin-helix domain-containing protein [Candidatus Omnitrophica bacterium]|nr:helix-hairpin-helix domain-containing protein [Candidatus Omnitrophota bacterium]
MSPAQDASVRLAVRVNTASAPEIAGLPGIGPTVAQRIVEDRQRHGHFLTLADLKRVKGVSRKTLNQLQGYVRFD